MGDYEIHWCEITEGTQFGFVLVRDHISLLARRGVPFCR